MHQLAGTLADAPVRVRATGRRRWPAGRASPSRGPVAQPVVSIDPATRTLSVSYEADFQASDLEACRRIADKIAVEL